MPGMHLPKFEKSAALSTFSGIFSLGLKLMPFQQIAENDVRILSRDRYR